MAEKPHFDLVFRGLELQTDLVCVQDPSKVPLLPRNTVPIGLPPVLPSVHQQLEEYLLHPENLPIHDYKRGQKFIPREKNVESLYHTDISSVPTTLVVERNPTSGKLVGFNEEFIADLGTTKNSTSMARAPGPLSESVRGSSTNYPFWPGGLDEPNLESMAQTGDIEDIDFDNDLLSIAPGLSEGMNFPGKSLNKVLKTETERLSKLHVKDLLTQADEIDFGDLEEEKEEDEKRKIKEETEIKAANVAEGENIDDIIKPSELPVVKLGSTEDQQPNNKDYEWAVWVDVNTPVHNFHKKIPDMAYKWPFELDAFQKQAILRLENHENVFVAAHTSAGKTVVAEYAIALSMRHMTRTIYTSPIKALSNQKFRDFKNTFEDVGLITGDVQLKPESSCLIMTTEILRSMLYNGSDVIRDLEWVIFDEVHYINDSERGVVWEEVLIMLPQHVNIILLSATVPNTMEFADWVGRTKRKHMYVVSTQKRPVPLEHYLYTGNSAKTSNELFMILDANKKFLQNGYYKALEAKKERASKSSQSYGAKGHRGGAPQQDKNIYLSVIEMLRKKEKLPIVAFTFSKKRIDENAKLLSSVDLTTQSEKSEVHIFFQKCISRLKPPDRLLPQVKTVAEMLKRGIGIHHSGVLPILKEVVEMLFGNGLVKVLFATETFAMGVNMPARTVVFDSIRKHDGTNFRDLVPGEYIQMAGRAGRRGLDTTGTVIILCKGDVPEMSDIHKMMLGKPTLLESQFRLTYSMILNLLRVEQLRVEDMMKRSFSEFHNQRDMTKRQEMLETIKQKLKDTPDIVDYSGDLEDYYVTCDSYHQLKLELQKIVMSHPQAIKSLTPGRVILIDTVKQKNSLGVVLQSGPTSSKDRTFMTLVLSEQSENPDGKDMNSEMSSQFPRPVLKSKLYRPEGVCGHIVIQLKIDDISVITTKTLKVAADKIVDDFKKRQIPRFRNDPPGQSASTATQELLRLVEANPDGLPAIDPVKDLHMRDMELVDRFTILRQMQDSLQNYLCVDEPNFEENFAKMRDHMKLKNEINNIQYLMSDASLQLLPEYQQRIEVLRQLQYIDKTNTVQLKGRVACEISNHELIITELVFENALTSLHPTEIAALLSCVVFEMKRCSEPNLAPSLVEAKEKLIALARKIGQLQKECGLKIPVEDYVDMFHFGLMEVAFEWARGMPFSEITELTDVNEGIIVRSIQRLDEVIKDVRNAARIIGDPVLHSKMEEASSMIKRDIVFAASLYTQ